VTKLIAIIAINLVTPKAAAKLELLLDKPDSEDDEWHLFLELFVSIENLHHGPLL
jgi:hypothetical protein